MIIKESLARRSIKSNASLASFCTHHPPPETEYRLNIPLSSREESGAGDP